MVVAHRALGTWTRKVDAFIAPSAFTRDKLAEGGIPRARIAVKPNFVAIDLGPGDGHGGFALYAGRLSAEKGIEAMLRAWTDGNPGLPLKIIGDGPLTDRVRAAAAERPGSIDYLGRQPLDAVYRLMGEAALILMPSAWYETFGRVVVESYARGTPVVACRLGAGAELI
ncbi:MAG: glycosyltransferase, partial [Rhodospirillales bacterium]|nr:glycosyltransferase [Rhodospirillales bacterium]